jgi:peptidoglycan/LPS O-acetylase OafA/YrhL
VDVIRKDVAAYRGPAPEALPSGHFGLTVAARRAGKVRAALAKSGITSATGVHAAYRPDIDGLRAVSILAVVLYHAFPKVLGSGYIGVDVFFVISGFLIGGLISAELAAGTFSFARFYTRRIRRLFPALILVVAFVLLVGWHMMFAEEFRLLGRHAFAASLFVANFPPMGEIGYFDREGHSKPLLHLWSLGIEEQFYFVWPVLAMLTRRSRRLFLVMTVVLAIASLALNVTSPAPGLAFYQPWTRFWELAVGVLVAHLPLRLSARWRDVCCIVGLALIVGVATADALKGFPGWWTTLPVAGAALVIASGPDTIVSRWVLASPPMVFVGKISYPLYLWHWPLLAFTWVACGSFPPAYLIQIMVAASFVLAWFTYRFVETPARFGLSAKRVVRICVPAMVVLGAFGFVTMTLDGIPARQVVQENLALAADTRPPLQTRSSDGSCSTPYGIAREQNVICQLSVASPTMLVIGDSVAMAFYSAISAKRVAADAALIATTSPNWVEPGCLASGPLEPWSGGNLICQRVMRDALSILDRTPSIKVVVVPTFSDNPYFNNVERLRQLQDAVAKRGRQLVYVAAPPGFYHPPEGCRPRHVEIMGINLTAPRDMDSCQEARPLIEATLKFQHDIFVDAARGAAGVVIFESVPVFCDATTCFQSDERGPLYYAWGHINERGSMRLLNAFLPWLIQRLK